MLEVQNRRVLGKIHMAYTELLSKGSLFLVRINHDQWPYHEKEEAMQMEGYSCWFKQSASRQRKICSSSLSILNIKFSLDIDWGSHVPNLYFFRELSKLFLYTEDTQIQYLVSLKKRQFFFIKDSDRTDEDVGGLWGKKVPTWRPVKSIFSSVQFSSVAQPCPTLKPHESQQARPPCLSPTPGVHSNSRPSSRYFKMMYFKKEKEINYTECCCQIK